MELDTLNPNEQVSSRNITLEQLVDAAQRIFQPCTPDIKEVAWWSVYEIGQRLTDSFDDLKSGDAATHQPLASGLLNGTRFHTVSVLRVADGKLMQLGQTLAADGRWRLFAFAGQGDAAQAINPARKLCSYLTDSRQSPLIRFTPPGADIDSAIDVRAVFQQNHYTLTKAAMPTLQLPTNGCYRLHDYEKAFCATANDSQNIYTLRGIDREKGSLVMMRPDEYIAHVFTLNDAAALAAFFGAFMLDFSMPSMFEPHHPDCNRTW